MTHFVGWALVTFGWVVMVIFALGAVGLLTTGDVVGSLICAGITYGAYRAVAWGMAQG